MTRKDDVLLELLDAYGETVCWNLWLISIEIWNRPEQKIKSKTFPRFWMQKICGGGMSSHLRHRKSGGAGLWSRPEPMVGWLCSKNRLPQVPIPIVFFFFLNIISLNNLTISPTNWAVNWNSPSRSSSVSVVTWMWTARPKWRSGATSPRCGAVRRGRVIRRFVCCLITFRPITIPWRIDNLSCKLIFVDICDCAKKVPTIISQFVDHFRINSVST